MPYRIEFKVPLNWDYNIENKRLCNIHNLLIDKDVVNFKTIRDQLSLNSENKNIYYD